MVRSADTPTVALFNVKFSENVGDGLISECVERFLTDSGFSVSVQDLAGRIAFGETAVRNRSGKLRALSLMPSPLRQRVVEVALGRRIAASRDAWRETIGLADHVVIGGGQLFQDDNLNFPLKIGAVLELCAESGVPVSVLSVGVSSDWSAKARRLFHRLAQCRIADVSVRDEVSQRNWSRHFSGTSVPSARFCPDPVLTLDHQPASGEGSAIGFCITHPRILAHHGKISTAGLMDFYVGTVIALCEAGHEVAMFSNGASEDERTIDDLFRDRRLTGLTGRQLLRRLRKPAQPGDLVEMVAGMRAVIAHRLHANIAAHALKLPCVGLGWDGKVEEFFRLSGNRATFVPADSVAPAVVVEKLNAAIATGVDDASWQELRERAESGLAVLASTIGAGPSDQ